MAIQMLEVEVVDLIVQALHQVAVAVLQEINKTVLSLLDLE
jgi:hypothetical protein